MAESYVTDAKPVNFISATAKEVENTIAASVRPGSRASDLGMLGMGRDRDDKRANYKSMGSSDTRTIDGISFSDQNILNATATARALGFTDKAAIFDFAVIDRFDPKARQTNKALEDYQKALERDKELKRLHEERRQAKTAEERRRIDAEIEERRKRHAEETGLNDRINDPNNDARARAAAERRKRAIEKKAEAAYAPNTRPKQASEASDHKKTKANADLFKRLTGGSPN